MSGKNKRTGKVEYCDNNDDGAQYSTYKPCALVNKYPPTKMCTCYAIIPSSLQAPTIHGGSRTEANFRHTWTSKDQRKVALIFTKMVVIMICTFMMIDHDVDGSGLDLFPHTWTAKEKHNASKDLFANY